MVLARALYPMAKSKQRAQSKRPTAADKTAAVRRLKFDYIKSNAFRVIHVDGAWGGLRPDLNFHLSLYNERNAIPKSLTVELDPQQLKAEEQVVTTEGREAVVREVEVCAIMDMATARALRDWLGEMLQKAEERLAEMVAADRQEES